MNETDNKKSGNKLATQAAGEPGINQKYDIDLILDIPLDVRVELGQVKMIVNDLLQLGQGSIVELNKHISEQVDVFISDKLIARGEVVVVEEKLGIRLTDIISPTERVKSLV
ncbi:MAG: flagellar motor switch protein FliN [Desulfobacteraceae bacterium]|nr:MAG: flagellar motor switch protein FliN [Desulfobacteraceae bacterium]